MESKYKENTKTYFTWLPFVGLLISIISSIYFLTIGKVMSILGILYILLA